MDIAKIKLGQDTFAIIDASDFMRLGLYNWQAVVRGNVTYAARMHKGKFVYLHREVLQAPADMVVDHIDGNGLNNTKANLRLATVAENSRNRGRSKISTQTHKGIRRKGKNWEWRLQIDERTIRGTCLTEQEAVEAYNRAVREHHGEFAVEVSLAPEVESGMGGEASGQSES